MIGCIYMCRGMDSDLVCIPAAAVTPNPECFPLGLSQRLGMKGWGDLFKVTAASQAGLMGTCLEPRNTSLAQHTAG